MANVTTKTSGAAKGKKMRKGFTLIEIIFVTVIIAMLAGLIIPKIINNAKASEYMSTLQQDLQSVKSAVEQYKADNGQIVKGFSTEKLKNYLPSSFVETEQKTIKGFSYFIDKNGDIVKISINLDNENKPEVFVTLKNWNDIDEQLKNRMSKKIAKEFKCSKFYVDDSKKMMRAYYCHF